MFITPGKRKNLSFGYRRSRIESRSIQIGLSVGALIRLALMSLAETATVSYSGVTSGTSSHVSSYKLSFRGL